MSRALDRYLAFVDEHDAGFSALLAGGSVVETSRTTAIVDGVRRAAAEQILLHLGDAGRPGPRLRMMVRTWITAVEAASLIWLDEDKQPAAGRAAGLAGRPFHRPADGDGGHGPGDRAGGRGRR